MLIDWFWEYKECHYCDRLKKCKEVNVKYKSGSGWDIIYTCNYICKTCLKDQNKQESN